MQSSVQLWSTLAPGFHQREFESWKQFLDFLNEPAGDYSKYVWRGHRCEDWELEPTISRLIGEARAARYPFQRDHLERFKFAARGRRGQNPRAIGDEDEWWALGQHHGLATPLLDWCTSPFVAAFFAFSGLGLPQTPRRAIFALHQPTVENLAEVKCRRDNLARLERLYEAEKGGKPLGFIEGVQLREEIKPEITFFRPLSDENQRLLSQGGLFTRVRTEKSLEAWVSENTDATNDADDLTLIKLLLPNDERDVCLRMLNRMNINPLTLFPDLTGASTYCNLFSEIRDY